MARISFLRRERRTTRHVAELEFRLLLERDDRHLRGKTVDVSTNGIRFVSDDPVVLGEPVVVALRLPNGSTWIDALGRVARIERGYRETDTGRAIAIELVDMESDDRKRLDDVLRTMPEPLPRRGVFRLATRRWA